MQARVVLGKCPFREVSSVQGCPYRGVPLNDWCPHMSYYAGVV